MVDLCPGSVPECCKYFLFFLIVFCFTIFMFETKYLIFLVLIFSRNPNNSFFTKKILSIFPLNDSPLFLSARSDADRICILYLKGFSCFFCNNLIICKLHCVGFISLDYTNGIKKKKSCSVLQRFHQQNRTVWFGLVNPIGIHLKVWGGRQLDTLR